MTIKENEKIRELYEVYEQPMFRIAFAILHNEQEAEDAVSDAFLRVIGRLDKIGDVKNDRTKKYMVKVIKSTSINIYRRNKQFFIKEMPIDNEAMQIPDSSPSVEKIIIDSENSRDLDRMLSKISSTDRRIVMMRCSDEMSWKEISGSLSMTESAARKRFERIKKRLISMKGEVSDGKI